MITHYLRILLTLSLPLLVVGGLFSLFSRPAAAQGNVIVVNILTDAGANDLGNCSLREAIAAANSNLPVDGCAAGSPGLPADRIIFALNGTISLTRAGPLDDFNLSGDLDIHESVIIEGNGAENTIIQGFGDRVFDIHSGAVTLKDLTVQGGQVTALDPAEGQGGGIRSRAILTLRNVIVKNNLAVDGGGLHHAGNGSLFVLDSLISDNAAVYSIIESCTGDGWGQPVVCTCRGGAKSGFGGGILANGNAQISRSRIEQNRILIESTCPHGTIETYQHFGGAGGGLFAVGTTLVQSSTISANSIQTQFSPTQTNAIGGAGILNLAELTLRNSVVAGNQAEMANGGGIYTPPGNACSQPILDPYRRPFRNFSGCGCELDLQNSTLSANASGFGGGLVHGGAYSTSCDLRIENSTISGNLSGRNMAGKSGGSALAVGLEGDWCCVSMDDAQIIHTTIVSNVNSLGGAAIQGLMTFRNTLIAYNNPNNCSGTGLSSGGHNLIDDTSCGLLDATDRFSNPIGLGPLSYNGGSGAPFIPPQTHPLLGANNLARDGGSCAGSDTPTDQRGISRPQGSDCDIGAFEVCAANAAPRVVASHSRDVGETRLSWVTQRGFAAGYDVYRARTPYFIPNRGNLIGYSDPSLYTYADRTANSPITPYFYQVWSIGCDEPASSNEVGLFSFSLTVTGLGTAQSAPSGPSFAAPSAGRAASAICRWWWC